VKVAAMTDEVRKLRAASPLETCQLRDVWVKHPHPDGGEPEKSMRFVTDLGDYSDEHVARMLLRATLGPIDSTFNQIRRRVAVAERGIRAPGGNSIWHINAPYNPVYLIQILEIFRVWKNFIGPPKSKKPTPAQKLGLAKGPIRYEDIVYFDIREYLN
jgi:hypothetical protein